MDTSYSSISLEALVNVTNPTPYTASIPSINIKVLCNGTVVGEAGAQSLEVKQGKNVNLLVNARWNPSKSGDIGQQIHRYEVGDIAMTVNIIRHIRIH